MPFESDGKHSFNEISPGGFEFGVQGWTWGPPVPKSITFFLDGTAMVCDQYGRPVRRAVLPDGRELRFADAPPDATRDVDGSVRMVVARPHFATHAQVIEALELERIDWQSYEVRYRMRDGTQRVRAGLKLQEAVVLQAKLVQEGNSPVMVDRTISCAGWPQLPYERLKKLEEVPPTPLEELRKIRDPELRSDALRLRREVDAARDKELQAVGEE